MDATAEISQFIRDNAKGYAAFFAVCPHTQFLACVIEKTFRVYAQAARSQKALRHGHRAKNFLPYLCGAILHFGPFAWIKENIKAHLPGMSGERDDKNQCGHEFHGGDCSMMRGARNG